MSWAVDEFVASLAGASGHTAEAYERCAAVRRVGRAWRLPVTRPAGSHHAAPVPRVPHDPSVRSSVDGAQGGVPAGISPVPPPPGDHPDRSGPVPAGAEGRGAPAPGAPPGRSRRSARRRLRGRAGGRRRRRRRDGVAGPRRARGALRRGIAGERMLRAHARVGRHEARVSHGARQGVEGASPAPGRAGEGGLARVPRARATRAGDRAHSAPTRCSSTPGAGASPRATRGGSSRAPSAARRAGTPSTRTSSRVRDPLTGAGRRPRAPCRSCSGTRTSPLRRSIHT